MAPAAIIATYINDTPVTEIKYNKECVAGEVEIKFLSFSATN